MGAVKYILAVLARMLVLLALGLVVLALGLSLLPLSLPGYFAYLDCALVTDTSCVLVDGVMVCGCEKAYTDFLDWCWNSTAPHGWADDLMRGIPSRDPGYTRADQTECYKGLPRPTPRGAPVHGPATIEAKLTQRALSATPNPLPMPTATSTSPP